MQVGTPENIVSLRETQIELNCWLDKQDSMWYQRSRLNWFQGGDQNTAYFHSKATSRFQKNNIDGLLDQNNVWKEDLRDIENIVLDYYSNLFKSSNPVEFTKLLQSVEQKVIVEMNTMLIDEFKEFEVSRALKQMYPLKSPGPDGAPPLFFQHFWPNTASVVTKTLLDFLNLGIIPPKFNEIHIVLIPKIKDPKRVTDYRPISLYNVIYKLVLKTLANRLKKILPKIISDTQSAFVHSRLITVNVLVAFEIMHHINQKKIGKIGEMALKLDMSKAYDRVE